MKSPKKQENFPFKDKYETIKDEKKILNQTDKIEMIFHKKLV